LDFQDRVLKLVNQLQLNSHHSKSLKLLTVTSLAFKVKRAKGIL